MGKNELNRVKQINSSKMELLPLYDWHLGADACNEKLVDKIIDYIKKTPNCYTFMGGDLIECAIYDNKINSVHTQKYQLQEQVEMLCEKLEPIKDKILFAICGNHEHRVEKATGLDVAALIALNLGVQYFKWETQYMIKMNTPKCKADKKNIVIYAHHGSGGGSTSGAKINAVERLHFRAPFANIIFSGHVHFTSETRKQINFLSQQGINKSMIQYFISCGTAHESDGYAAMKGYGAIPVGLMLAKLEINSNNELRVKTEVFE